MYKVVILDEFEDDIDRFQLYVHINDKEKKFEVIPILPKPDFEETITEILGSNPDAVVSDYRLNEYMSSITYDGIRVVNEILERREDFPCFVLTSFDDDAVKESDDVNMVYIKGVMSGESNAKITFLERIEKQIQKHQFKISEARARLKELQLIRETRLLDLTEEDEFVELSHFLDTSFVGKESLPRSFFSNDTNERLNSLIMKTNELLKTLNQDNDAATEG